MLTNNLSLGRQNKSAARPRAALALLLTLALAHCQQQKQSPAAPSLAPAALARLENLVPAVLVRQSDAGGDVDATAQMGLHAGDIVKTQKDGTVDVVFAGNNRIHLGPSAILLLEEQGGEDAELGAVVLQGSIRASAGGAGVALRVRSPVGSVRLSGAKVSVLDVSMEGGLAVQLGEVALDKPDNQGQVELQVGQVVTLASAGSAEGLVVSSFAPTADLAPMTFEVPEGSYGRARGLRGAAKIQGRGERDWRPIKQEAALGNGDKLHVDQGGAVEVRLDPHVRMTVAGDTDVAFAKANLTGEHRDYAFALSGGCLQLQAERAEAASVQAVTLAGTELKVEPGASRADVVVHGDGAKADVLVRYGVATLANGEQLRAGQKASIAGGKLAAPPRAAFAGAVGIAEGRPSVVYYQGSPPPIRFEAKGQPSPEETVQFARDMAVSDHVASEHLTGNAFLTDEVGSGRTWWRVGQAEPAPLDVLEEPQRAVNAAARETDLDDNGAAAHIYYQNVLPNIRLHWAAQAKVSSYRVDLYAIRNPNAALWSTTTAELSARVPATVWHDGSFHWRVTPLAADGRALTHPDDNALKLTHDTDVHGLRLRAPASDGVVATEVLLAQGDVEPGCTLLVNGEKVTLDDKHRFKQPLTLRTGDNHVVFRLVKPGRPDRIYVRLVRRGG